MLATQFQDFYNEICSEGQAPEDVREKIITHFLKISHLFKNAEEINDKKGNVDKRYLKRVDLMISTLPKEKESLLKLFESRNKEEIDSAIEEKIRMITRVYTEALKKKEEEDAKEKQRLLQLEKEKETALLIAEATKFAAAPTDLSIQQNTSARRALSSSADPKDVQRYEMSQKQDYEQQMLNVAEQMKVIARSYTTQISADDQVLERINEQADKNINTLQKKNKKLDVIIQKEKKIGFFRLIFMAIVALLLFVATGALIFFDRTLFGRS